MNTLGDIRLVQNLADGCAAEVKSLCSGITPGEGRVISCLQEKRTMIMSTVCRDALLHITGMATDDWRMDFNLFNVCLSLAQCCSSNCLWLAWRGRNFAAGLIAIAAILHDRLASKMSRHTAMVLSLGVVEFTAV